MEFHKLKALVQDDGILHTEILNLLEMKKAGKETGLGPKNKIINAFIERELDRLEGYAPTPMNRNVPLHAFNAIFKNNLG